MKIDTIDPSIAARNVAAIQRAQQQSSPPKNSQNKTESTASAPVIGENHASDKVSIQLEVPRKTLETLQQFGQVGDFLNTLATNLRHTQEALKSSSDVIDKMKEKLDTIVKNYPPYPMYSKERMAILLSYSGLQKEIRSLMVPPPPPPVYEKVQHLWQNLFTSQDGTVPAPKLPMDASDAQVKLAATQLDSLSGQVSHVREALSNSIKAM
jgi:hypothetical protein